MNRRAWIDAAQRVLAGEREGIVCPANGDAELQVDWVPFDAGVGGEFRLACPLCGETNFVLVRAQDPTPDSSTKATTSAIGSSALGGASASLFVELVFPVSFRPGPVVWGTVVGELRRGDEVVLTRPDGTSALGRVVDVDLNRPEQTRPDQFGFVFDGKIADIVAVGDRIRKQSGEDVVPDSDC